MGVRGLQTFLKNNSAVLSERVELNDTPIVIDANNLFFLLFCQMSQAKGSDDYRCDIYSGNLVAFGEFIRSFFKNLEKCCIRPILVFDGSVVGKQSASDEVVLKDKETHRRGLDRFMKSKFATEENLNDNEIMLPKIINRIFKSIVLELELDMVIAPYEADTHIARVANDLNCPVLTNDSDFFIYELKVGFILIDFFFYKQLIMSKNGKEAIQSYIYRQDKLMRVLPGLRMDNMPVLSILLGNDYIETGAFNAFLEELCNDRNIGPFVAETRSHLKIACLLNWLQNKSFDQVVEYISSRLHSSILGEFKRKLPMLIRNYKIEEKDNLEAELEAMYPSDLNPSSNVLPEHEPKLYLKNLMLEGKLTSCALDIIFHNTNYNYPTIDDFQLESSSSVKNRPYAVLVTLLRPKSFLNMSTYRRQVEAEAIAFPIWDRIDGEYRRYLIKPLEELDGFGPMLHLNCYTLITLAPSVKRSILMAAFRFNEHELGLLSETISSIFLPSYSDEASLCLIIVKYISLETGRQPKPQFVDALLLTFFYYAAIQGQLKPNTFEDNDYGRLLLTLKPHSMSNNNIRYKPSVGLYKRIMHFLSELSQAYSVYIILNGLLDRVCHDPKFEKFYNGVLIFRLTKLFRQEEVTMTELCNNMSALLDVSNTIKTILNCDAR